MENRENVWQSLKSLVFKQQPLVLSVIFFFKLCRKIKKIEARIAAAYFIKKNSFQNIKLT